MTRLIFSFLIVPLLTSAQPTDKIDSFINYKMQEKHIPGLALAIIKDGQVIRKSVYGSSNLEQASRVNEHTVFEIASMTKQFTCAAILLLEQDGQLTLEDKLSKYIADLPLSWTNTTLNQLMNHTAGLRDDWNEPTSYFLENHTPSKMLSAQQKQDLLFKPGESHHYSSGPFFLGLVIEKITGKHYSAFLNDRVFTPLNMNCSSLYNDSVIVQNRAAGYWWKNNRIQNGVDIPQAAEGRADVGIITCLEDMIKWSKALRDTNLLKPESLRKMFSPGKLNNGRFIPYGLGWYIFPLRGKVVYEHGGAFRTGFNSRIVFFPVEKLEIVILCNLWRAGLAPITFELASYYIPDFQVIKETGQVKDDLPLRKNFEQIFHQFANHSIGVGDLYKQFNVSGFDPDELEEMLKGFKSLQLIAVQELKSNPIDLFGKKISEIYFYRALADQPTIWSFHLTETRELISINIEE